MPDPDQALAGWLRELAQTAVPNDRPILLAGAEACEQLVVARMDAADAWAMIRRLRQALVEHHLVGVMDDAEPGQFCSACRKAGFLHDWRHVDV